MSAKSKLKSALNAIDDAKKRLKRARYDAEDDTEIRRAIKNLDDAEDEINRALREVKKTS
ncbi:MAG: hypothetical protein JXI43_05945 [Tissierellales bacterium]|nr:hypothetical protein [Tissierellales bacterium]